jgi:Tol biopolymer transport system component
MVWSPDGSRIAFLRSATNEIVVVDADGSEPRAIRDNAAVYHALVGWMDPDHLLTTEPRADGVVVQALDLTDGSTRDLFVMSSNKADTVVSPDGHWIAFTSSLGGALGNGLYVSRLGDPGRRLVAALDGLALYFPIWSPDDQWLILSLPDPGDPVDLSAQVLLNLESCQSFRLPDLGGDVYSWGK